MSLNLRASNEPLATIDADAIIAAVFDDIGLSPAAQELDKASGGRISALLESDDVSGKLGRTALLLALDGVKARRVLLIGLGESARLDTGRYVKAALDSIRSLRNAPVKHIHSTLPELAVQGRDTAWKLRQAALAAEHVAYTYTATKNSAKPAQLSELSLAGGQADAAALAQASALAEGIALTRELGNLPPNICTPSYLAEQARLLAATNPGVNVEILDREAMEALGMGSLLGVARGSANPPKLIVLRHDGGQSDAKPYVLVGKGITFDTGGISIKPAAAMEEMKFDMCGAATVLGTFLAAVKLNLKINLVAIAAAVENMPDGASYRPSDVLTSMSGKTIEVLNTDAEGRLILCDALTYAQRFHAPQTLIDVATLTGACVVALGKHAHGLMSRDDDLAAELIAAGEAAHDRAWRLPLWDDYQSGLDSIYADVANIGGKWGGAITAGCFLARFTEGTRWAHLDIAGTAWDEGRKGLATGRPVGLLVEWLSHQQ